MPQALITGACGFSARHLARHLSDRGYRLYGMTRGAESCPEGRYHQLDAVDIADFTRVAACVKKASPSLVFHLAARTAGTPPELTATNVAGAANLLEAVKMHAPSASVVLIGSAAEYGEVPENRLPVVEDYECRPANFYGLSKYSASLLGMQYHARFGLKVTVARTFNLIGPGISENYLVGALARRLKKAVEEGGNVPVKVGNVDTYRDFIDIEDAVRLYIAIAEGAYAGGVVNVCSGVPVCVRDVVEMLMGLSGGAARYEVDPALVRPTDVIRNYGSNAKARQIYGFVPAVPLGDSLLGCWKHIMAR